MKIRQGFVSNSSSTSFILVVTIDAHNQACQELDVNQRNKIHLIVSNSSFTTLGNETVMIITGYNYDNYHITIGGADIEQEGRRDWEEYEEAFKKYLTQLPTDSRLYKEYDS